MRALVDTNIIIDVLQKREPWCGAWKKIFLAIANKQVIGCLTAKQIADIHYFSRKQFKEQENVDKKCRTVITKLLALFELLDTLGIDCQDAIAIESNDYEDAIMISTAVRSSVDAIITRDKSHYRHAPIPIYTADEFVNKFDTQNE